MVMSSEAIQLTTPLKMDCELPVKIWGGESGARRQETKGRVRIRGRLAAGGDLGRRAHSTGARSVGTRRGGRPAPHLFAGHVKQEDEDDADHD